MKKILAVILTLTIIFTLCACGKKEDTDEKAVGMANPWRACEKSEISEEFYLYMEIPEDAKDVVYQMNDTIHMGEAKYTSDGTDFVYRVQYTPELQDISGMYCKWDLEENGNMMANVDEFYENYQGNETKTMCKSDSDGDAQVINWYDPVFGRTMCLIAESKDLNGFDIQALAEQMYYQPDPDSVYMECFGDGWVTSFDVRDIRSREEGDSVIFSFYNPTVQTAGSNYVIITTKENTDYETVLNEIKDSFNDKDGKIDFGYFGADSIESYTYIAPSNPSKESGLSISNTYTAIPTGNNVILIEGYATVESDDEIANIVSGAFEYILDGFFLN